MPGEYAGHLRTDDPLHVYLSHYVLQHMGVTAQKVDFRVFCLKETKVYRYEESHSRTQVVGKFFVNGRHHAFATSANINRRGSSDGPKLAARYSELTPLGEL